MKLSIVIICWNDSKVIIECLKSIYAETRRIEFEVIVSDNGSTDGSVEMIRKQFGQVVIVENGANLGFAKGNNAGITLAHGEYVLILNPDTIILDRATEKLVAYAETHLNGGAFGCRVLNPDGSYQNPARPVPTVRGYLISALGLRWLGRFSETLVSDVYPGWHGRTERAIGFQSGCCILFRTQLLKRLDGFDERFFYHFEESDLCLRVWKAGAAVLYYPDAMITHLGGQSVGRFPIRFTLETYRSQYRFFFKHYGLKGLVRIRRIVLLHLWLRRILYGWLGTFQRTEALRNRLHMYRIVIKWNHHLSPKRFIQNGDEPDLGYAPLMQPQNVRGSLN